MMKNWIKFIIISLGLYVAVASVFDARLITDKEVKNFSWSKSLGDISGKNVLKVADNEETKMFDFLAPYYLFIFRNRFFEYQHTQVSNPKHERPFKKNHR